MPSGTCNPKRQRGTANPPPDFRPASCTAAPANLATGAERMPKRSNAGVRRLAWLLDDLIRIPGTQRRIGLDPLIGLIPVGGDVASGAVATYIIVAASRLGAPPAVLLRMAGNVMIDTVFGSVPVIGDVFDATWKANRRNAALLQRYIDDPGPVRRSSRRLLVLLVSLIVLLVIAMAVLSFLLVRYVAGLAGALFGG
jgi:hypothetical protein